MLRSKAGCFAAGEGQQGGATQWRPGLTGTGLCHMIELGDANAPRGFFPFQNDIANKSEAGAPGGSGLRP